MQYLICDITDEMNSESDKNGNFNQNGVMNRESMATVLVNAYKLEWNENSNYQKNLLI